MATRRTLDRQHPSYQEGKRMALEMEQDHILAEAKVSVFISLNLIHFVLEQTDGWQIILIEYLDDISDFVICHLSRFQYL